MLVKMSESEFAEFQNDAELWKQQFPLLCHASRLCSKSDLHLALHYLKCLISLCIRFD
jgi:hypothetical protein